jgi:hypothetical protein
MELVVFIGSGTVALGAFVVIALVTGERDAARFFGFVGSLSGVLLGVLACVLSDRIAVASLGGPSEAVRLVLMVDMNAVAHRSNLIIGTGVVLALLSLGFFGLLVAPTATSAEGKGD